MAKELRLQVKAVNKASPEFRKLEQDISRVNNRINEVGSRSATSLGRFRSEVSQSKQVTSEFAQVSQSGFLSLNSSILKTVGALGALVTAFAAVKNAISASVKTAAKFEFLRVRLENMYNSVEKGREAFEKFNQIAATTPFTLDKVVEAGATLKAFMGDVFSPQYLKIAADLAAFMGTDIVEAASAMGRAFAAGAGAADILRERGILNLIKTRQHIEDFSKITLEEFREAMIRTFTDPKAGIVGATSKLAETVVGLESNLSDAFTRLQNAVGEKFAPAYKSALKTMITITNAFVDTFTDLGAKVEMTSQKIIKSFLNMNSISDLQNVIEQLQELQLLLIKTGDLKQIQYLAQHFQFLTQEEKFAIESADNMWQAVDALGSAVKRLQDKLDDKKIKEYTKSLDLLGKGLAVLDLSTGNITQTMTEAEQTIKRFGLAVNDIRVAEGIVESYEKLNQKLDALRTKATIELNIKGDVGVETLNELEKIQQQLNELEPLYVKAKVVVESQTEGDAEPPDFTKKMQESFQYFDQFINNWFSKQQSNVMQKWKEIGDKGIEFTDEQLQAEMEFRQNFLNQQYDWEAKRQLEHLDQLWATMNKAQKAMLGGEAAYQKARAQITAQATYYQNAMILSNAKESVQSFGDILNVFAQMGGEWAEGMKLVMAAQAMIDTFAGINRAFATLPTPIAIVVSAAIGAAGLMNVNRILTTNIPQPRVSQPPLPQTPEPDFNPKPINAPRTINRRFATGGIVGADTVEAVLAPGEAVIPRNVVNKERTVVERLITGEPVGQKEMSVTVNLDLTVNAIDGEDVADFVKSPEFRIAFADAVNDGLITLKEKQGKIEVRR